MIRRIDGTQQVELNDKLCTTHELGFENNPLHLQSEEEFIITEFRWMGCGTIQGVTVGRESRERIGTFGCVTNASYIKEAQNTYKFHFINFLL